MTVTTQEVVLVQGTGGPKIARGRLNIESSFLCSSIIHVWFGGGGSVVTSIRCALWWLLVHCFPIECSGPLLFGSVLPPVEVRGASLTEFLYNCSFLGIVHGLLYLSIFNKDQFWIVHVSGGGRQ